MEGLKIFSWFSWFYFFRVVIPAIVALLAGISIERFLESKISSFGEKHGILESQVYLMKTSVRWLIVILLIILEAGIFGISIGSLWISISAIIAMVVVGLFAGWSLLANMLAALITLIWQPFQVGDEITILPDDISGEVVDMSLFFGRLETENGDIINIPNVTFLQKYTQVHKKSSSEKKPEKQEN